MTLSDETMVVADAVKGRTALLIVTFSKGAGSKASAWAKEIQAKGLLKDVLFYEVAQLEDVPRIFRGMAIRGMRKGVPPEMQSTFVILTSDTDAWKKFVSFASDDDPYLLLLDAKGTVRLRIAGEKNDKSWKQLCEALTKVQANALRPSSQPGRLRILASPLTLRSLQITSTRAAWPGALPSFASHVTRGCVQHLS